jgi:hypothetical protein
MRIVEMGVRENIDLKLEIRQIADVDAELFKKQINAIFIPTGAANRELHGCANKPALLLCDNCASDCSEEILRELARNGILVLTYPAHTRPLFQVLDVLLFRRLKMLTKYLPKDDNEERGIDHILRILHGSEAVTTSVMIRTPSEKIGFGYHRRDGNFCLAVDEGRIRGASDFYDIWERNYFLESLSARRRNQK